MMLNLTDGHRQLAVTFALISVSYLLIVGVSLYGSLTNTTISLDDAIRIFLIILAGTFILPNFSLSNLLRTITKSGKIRPSYIPRASILTLTCCSALGFVSAYYAFDNGILTLREWIVASIAFVASYIGLGSAVFVKLR